MKKVRSGAVQRYLWSQLGVCNNSNTEIFSDASWSFPMEYPYLNLSVYYFNEILQSLRIWSPQKSLIVENFHWKGRAIQHSQQYSWRAPENLSVYYSHEILSILGTSSPQWSSALSTVLNDNPLGGLPRWGPKCFHSPNLHFSSDKFWLESNEKIYLLGDFLTASPPPCLGGERNRNQEFVFRFRQCRYRISCRKKTENL